MTKYRTKPGTCIESDCQESHEVERVPSVWTGATDQYRAVVHGQPVIWEVHLVTDH